MPHSCEPTNVLVVFLPDDDRRAPGRSRLAAGVQGLDDQRAVRRRVPFDEDHLGFDRSPLQLADEKAASPA